MCVVLVGLLAVGGLSLGTVQYVVWLFVCTSRVWLTVRRHPSSALVGGLSHSMGAYVYNYRLLAGYFWFQFGNPAAVLRFWYVGALIGRERRFTGGIRWVVCGGPDTAVCRV
jgi:hypothetical protein